MVDQSVIRAFCWICLVVIILLIALQLTINCGWNQTQRQRYAFKKQRAFYWSFISVFLAQLSISIFHLAQSYALGSCNLCKFWSTGNSLSHQTSMLATRFFLMNRAQMAQGIAPVASQRCFKYILPIAFVMIFISFSYGIVTDKNMQISCLRQNNIHFCHMRYDINSETIFSAIGMAIFEAFMCFLLLWLFVKPFMYMFLNDNTHSSPSRATIRVKLTLK